MLFKKKQSTNPETVVVDVAVKNNDVTTKESPYLGAVQKKKVPKKLFIIGACVLFAVAVIGSLLVFTNNGPTLEDLPQVTATDVELMSPEQASKYANVQVDVKNDPEGALVKATALASTGNNQASLELFKQVASLPGATFRTYETYALALASNGKLEDAIAALGAAIDKLKADTSTDATVKQTELSNLQDRQRWFKEELAAGN